MIAYRSISGRSRPPYCDGQLSPIQPRAPSARLNGREKPESHESHFGSKSPFVRASDKKERTSRRSSATDRSFAAAAVDAAAEGCAEVLEGEAGDDIVR